MTIYKGRYFMKSFKINLVVPYQNFANKYPILNFQRCESKVHK